MSRLRPTECSKVKSHALGTSLDGAEKCSDPRSDPVTCVLQAIVRAYAVAPRTEGVGVGLWAAFLAASRSTSRIMR